MCVSRFCERLSLSETLFHSMSFGLNGAEWRVHRCRVSSIDRAGALRRWPRRRWRRIRGCRDLARIRCYFLLLRFTIISSFSFLTAQRSHKLIQALLFILTNTYIYLFSISVLFLISHHPSLPRFLVLSFIHEGIEVFSLLGRLSSPVLSSPSINSPYLYLSLSLWQIFNERARVALNDRARYRLDYRRFTLGRQPHRRFRPGSSL